MSLTDRFHQARERRDARVIGRRAALGLASPEVIDLRETDPTTPQSLCPSCGHAAEVEMLDLNAGQRSLRCRFCAHRWVEALPQARQHARH